MAKARLARTRSRFGQWLFSGSGVLVGSPSCHQGSDQFAEQGFTTTASIVNELEEAEIERQLFLRDAAVWPQPGAQQRPEPLERVNVHLAKAVAVLVARVLATSVTDGLVLVAPNLESGIDV